MEKTRIHPTPSYVADGIDSPLTVDPKIYGPIGLDLSARQERENFVIPVRSGAAFVAPAGSVIRFTTHEGPQVLDVNLWSLHNPRERFWAARTRQFYGAHVGVGARLWSNLPYLRPLATVVADTLNYGLDDDGAGCHDLLGTRCDPYVSTVLSDSSYDFHCHSNLTRAVAPYGLTELDVHDVINVFQVTGLMHDDERYYMKACPAQPGDYFELLAETDLLVAASTCPGGDLSVPLWGPDAGAEPICNPIRVEVFDLAPSLLEQWTASTPAAYHGASGGRHGFIEPAIRPGLAHK
ncbi:urea carboxylase-associated family protein [Rhodococcus sp. KBS0724]|uniref:urea carboxylase-associated family protein n=1 Tax=Rhodococcus sp. KBS0724 TaxID=1179674 RepID=UPI00110DAF66|nr:urea carboxylase-associated family protein [Rhodococcus sp. KBS0724]TSD40419.1 urea carboxylase-associated family protein [Rhodococcus sp. KBS0724]